MVCCFVVLKMQFAHLPRTHYKPNQQVYLSVYGYAGEVGQYTLRVETGVSELQSAVRASSRVSRWRIASNTAHE